MSDVEFTPDEEEIKVLVEGVDEIPKSEEEELPEGYKDLDKKALIEKLEAEKAAREEAKRRADEVAALKEGLASLGQDLKRPTQTVVQPQPQARKSEDEYKEEFNEKFVEDPYSAMVKFQTEKLAPEIQRLMMSNLQVSKQFLQLDPDRKDTYAKYRDEVEEEIAKVDPRERLGNPQVYQQAHDRVVARHINDIVEMKVKEVLEKQESEKKKEPPRQPGYVENTMNPPPKKKPNYIILTQEEKNRANLLGIPLAEYARYLKEKGKK